MKFLKKSQEKSLPKSYNPLIPSGLIAHTDKGYFYVKNNKKFRLSSDRAVDSWGLPVISTLESKISHLTLAGVLGFRDGTLIKDISNGKIYLVSDSKRRHVINPDVLEWLGVKPIEVGLNEALVHEEGEPLE